MININWIKSISDGIKSNPADNTSKPFLWEGSPYYISTYVCPECEKFWLYKLRVRGAKSLFNGRPVSLFNLFTCPVCRKFYASTAVGPLSQSQFTSLPLSQYALVSQTYSESEYTKKLAETLPYFNG